MALLDADLAAPALHLLCGGMPGQGPGINEYLRGECSILAAARDVSDEMPAAERPGRLFLVTASDRPAEVAAVARSGYDLGRMADGVAELGAALALDHLLIDSPAGLNEASLSLMALADAVGIVLRLDRQDCQGTAVTVELARRLPVPRLSLLVNLVSPRFDAGAVQMKMAETYQCEVAAVLYHSDALAAQGSAGLFVSAHPHHPLTAALRAAALRLAD